VRTEERIRGTAANQLSRSEATREGGGMGMGREEKEREIRFDSDKGMDRLKI
jgi:hypothetical protein